MNDAVSSVFRDGTHVLPVRVYYEDTDAAGVVYHATFLRYAERARTEMLRSLGRDNPGLWEVEGVAFMVRRCVADYLAPARLDDWLEIVTRLTEVGFASMSADQRVRRGNADLVRMDMRIACVGRDGRPQRIPRTLRATLLRASNGTRTD